VLDDIGVAHLRAVRVETGIGERTSLPQKVPAPVERDLERREAPPVGVGCLSARLALPELVLPRHELLDVPVYDVGGGQLRRLPKSDRKNWKTLRMSRKIDAASSGALPVSVLIRSRWKSNIV